ncbi:MAG: phosphoglucosamine mutase [Candidatus Aminicenantes bacterium]|nr:phosphoglucosamine mutase [Candidatus Aminicenantes bacterium]
MPRLFGTDGIRGQAGGFPLDDGSVFSLGRTLAESLRRRRLEPRVLVGRDTRESGPRIEAALTAGIRAGGGSVAAAGIIPTPAVPALVLRRGMAAGVMISASHNPYRDNGLKFFDARGMKLAEEWEDELERGLADAARDPEAVGAERRGEAEGGFPGASPDPARPAAPVSGIPEASSQAGPAADYMDFLLSRFKATPGGRRLRLVLDCANGAAYDLGPRLFRGLGFEVETIACRPDDRNINEECGSQHPGRLAAKVVESGADMGIAWDGDADRAVWVDEKGRALNGDHTLYVQGRRLKEAGRLAGDVVVATTMSNMGLERALGRMGVRLERTRVGDKYVLERMRELGAALGGERSGHTIFLEDGPAGDGLLTALKMAEALVESGGPLSALVKGLDEYPQELVNVPVARKPDLETVPEVREALAAVRAELEGRGRIDVRYSGTENVARVMVEADDPELVRRCARRAAAALARNLGA